MPTRDLTLLLKAQDQMSVALREVAAAARSLEGATGGLEKQTAKATDTMRGFGNVMMSPANMLKMSVGFFAMGTAIGAIQSAMEATKYAIIGFNSILEQSSVAFTVMTGSADIAQQHLEELQAFARVTPFDFPELLEASRRLQAYGIDVQDIIPTLTTLGNITAGVGREKLPQLILAFGQVQAATRLTGMELRQFSETGVPLLGALATQMGKTTGQIQQMVSEGLVSFQDVRKALESMASEGGRFGNMMQRQSRTFEGAMSNIRDAASQIGATAFQGLFESARDMTVGIADKLTALNVSLKENADAWARWAVAVDIAMALSAAAVIGGIGSKIGPALIGLVGLAGRAGAALRFAFSPVGIVTGGIIAAIEFWNRSMEHATKEAETMEAILQNINSLQEMEAMGASNVAAELDKQREALNKLLRGGELTEFQKSMDYLSDVLKKVREAHLEPIIDPETTADVLATAIYIANIRAEAEKLAKSGDLEGAAKLLESLSIDMATAANQVVAWSRETEKGSRAVKEVLEEIIPVMEQLNRANAFKVWREDMKALLAEGDLEGVIAGFEAIGWTAKNTAQEILEMSQELADDQEKIAKKAVAEAERIVQGTADAIRDTIGAGGTLEQAMAAFAKSEWIRSLEIELKKALTAGLTPSPELIAALQEIFDADKAVAEAERIVQGQADAIRSSLAAGGTVQEGLAAFAKSEWIATLMAELQKALKAGLTPSPELIQALKDGLTDYVQAAKDKLKELADFQIEQSRRWVEQLEQETKDWHYIRKQQLAGMKQQVIEFEGVLYTIEGLNARFDIERRNMERQARHERLEELGKEIGFQESRLQTSLAAASERERAQQILLIRQLREQLLAAETGKPLVMQVNGHELGRVTGWAQNDLTRMLARFGV